MAMRIMSKFETLRICKSLQATVQTKLKVPMDNEIGFACKIWATSIGEKKSSVSKPQKMRETWSQLL